MKKTANILITFLFLISFIGIQINKHYSNGRLYSVSLFKEAKTCYDETGVCEMKNMPAETCQHHKKAGDPCKDVSRIYKINNLFMKESFSLNPVVPELSTILTNKCLVKGICVNTLKNTFFFPSLPPILTDTQSDIGLFLC